MARWALGAGFVLSLTACAGDGGPDGERTDLTVFAAASLTDVFTELESGFEETNPGIDVTFNFGASSALVAQILEGAPVDVFASADEAQMAALVDGGGTAGDPAVFATNALEIVVAPGNPLGITGIVDLVREDLVVVTCAVEVPCGAYAQQVFDAAGAEVVPDSYEENVRSVVSKVVLGEADAGIVYRTDVLAAGPGASGVAIPAASNVVASYPIVVTAEAANPAAADAFVTYVQSDAARRVLDAAGFATP